MYNGGLIWAVIGTLALGIVASIGVIYWRGKRLPSVKQTAANGGANPATLANPARPGSGYQTPEAVADHIFDDAFREELRNRGRLHFEKVLGENAMFLQQDLRQTTTQLNEYMRSEITRTLQEEFKKYEQSIADAKNIALGSIEKTITTIEQQREFLETQMQTQAEVQKAHVMQQFEKNMASIINHYVLRAIGDQIDLSDQLEYILAQLEANKTAINEDIKRGA